MIRLRTELRPIEVVDEVLCNVCGEGCSDDALSAEVEGGYDSPLGDGNHYRVDVCGRCLVAWFATFKIDPLMRDE